jgi:hypothetical protein
MRTVFAAIVTLALLPASVCAGEFYYVIVFAFEGDINLPRFAHSFATFVKATGEGPYSDSYTIEAQTLSWSPLAGEIRIARFAPERGTNLDLSGTLRWAHSLGSRVTRWGPFQVQKELYDRACRQIARLESGTILYKTLDGELRPDRAFNCIHALTDLDTERGLLDTGADYGEDASYRVAYHFLRWMICPWIEHEWVYARLGPWYGVIDHRTWGRAP